MNAPRTTPQATQRFQEATVLVSDLRRIDAAGGISGVSLRTALVRHLTLQQIKTLGANIAAAAALAESVAR